MFPRFLPINLPKALAALTLVSMPMSAVHAQDLTNMQSMLENRLPAILQDADQIGNAGIVMHEGEVIA